MAYEHFGVGVSLPLTTAQLLAALKRLVGDRRRIDLSRDKSRSDADILVTVVPEDETWVPRAYFPRTIIEWWSDAGLADLGPYPDLRFAVELWRAYGADSYCDFYPFADDGQGPRARGRFLACLKGQWWVAKTVYPPHATGPGDETVQLIRPIEVPSSVAAR